MCEETSRLCPSLVMPSPSPAFIPPHTPASQTGADGLGALRGIARRDGRDESARRHGRAWVRRNAVLREPARQLAGLHMRRGGGVGRFEKASEKETPGRHFFTSPSPRCGVACRLNNSGSGYLCKLTLPPSPRSFLAAVGGPARGSRRALRVPVPRRRRQICGMALHPPHTTV